MQNLTSTSQKVNNYPYPQNLITTNQKIEVENYPYGYTLKTTLFDTMEFNPKKGYRHITQTINPKNGKLNAPKKSTYAPLKIRFYDENKHIKCYVFDFNGTEEINKGMKFLFEHFLYFDKKEIEYFYNLIFTMLRVDITAKVQYAGYKLEDLKPLYHETIIRIKDGINNPTINNFNFMLNIEKIKALEIKDFNPFINKIKLITN